MKISTQNWLTEPALDPFISPAPLSVGSTGDQFRKEVLEGLQQTQKTLPCKYFYDEIGSKLFDEICDLDEYYLTRTELSIMESSIEEMAASLEPGCVLIEYGSGSSTKTRLLLNHLPAGTTYVPIDISRDHLYRSSLQLSEEYPHLDIVPVCADYTEDFELPDRVHRSSRKIVYFPGSTLGNFNLEEAEAFLCRIAQVCGRGGSLLIGIDLIKSTSILESAYNDSRGVTAAFNLNLLERINRELNGNFPIDRFRHFAPYNPLRNRIEMRLISEDDRSVFVDGVEIRFRKGEYIHTENSYKYSLEAFDRLADRSGFQSRRVWMDDARFFSVNLLNVR